MNKIIFFILMQLQAIWIVGQQPIPTLNQPTPQPTPQSIGNPQINEARIIPCSQIKINDVQFVSNIINSTIDVLNISVESNVPPPQKAVDRINGGITIRYFDPITLNTAQLLKSELEKKYSGTIKVFIEDMRPYYATPMKPELINYLEIWIK